MTFVRLLCTLALATTVFAQLFNIATPTPNQVLTIGQPFTVEVDQPDSQGPFQSVSVVIGLQGCGSTSCASDDSDAILGNILYAGDFSPQRHENFKPPYQNFTFTLGNNLNSENAVIHVAQFFLSGAGPSAQLVNRNVSVRVAAKGANGAKFRRVRLDGI